MVEKSLQDIDELYRIQRKLAPKVILVDIFRKPIQYVAGIDLAFMGDMAFTACVIVDYATLEVISTKTVESRLDFPYIPTLLFFREGPSILKAIGSSQPKADIYFINAQGFAHPKFIGCASHVGVLANVPTIGVTSRKLCGEYEHDPKEAGEAISMRHSRKAVGWVTKSAAECKPIFVSPGHRVSLESSLKIVVTCLKGHRLPEPLRLAHIAANKEKRK